MKNEPEVVSPSDKDKDMSMSLFSTPQKRFNEDTDPFVNSGTCSSFDTSTPKKQSTSTPKKQSTELSVTPQFRPSPFHLITDSHTTGTLMRKRRKVVEDAREDLVHGEDQTSSSISTIVPGSEADEQQSADSTHNYSTLTWSLTDVLEFDGCGDRCVTLKHDLNEYDILIAHATFSSKDLTQQRQWLFDYFCSNCPNDSEGQKDPKSMKYMLCGKNICLPLWLIILSVSSSRFYDVRKEFVNGKSNCLALKKTRQISAKSCQAIAWLSSFFERIGDKRPDKDGIYLPTCLTERSIYGRLIEELYKGDSERAICFSQFNRLFRTEFSNVTIPKVLLYLQLLFKIMLLNTMYNACMILSALNYFSHCVIHRNVGLPSVIFAL